MITKDIIEESYIQRIVARDSKIIRDTQHQVVSENFTGGSGFLQSYIKTSNHKVEGTHFAFPILNYLRFLDIKKKRDRMQERRDLALYNRVIWGVLYNETLPALRYGLTQDIRNRIKASLQSAIDTQTKINFPQ